MKSSNVTVACDKILHTKNIIESTDKDRKKTLNHILHVTSFFGPFRTK